MTFNAVADAYERIFKRSAQIGDNLTNNRKKNVMKSVIKFIISESTTLPDCISALISTFWSQYPDNPICKGDCDKKDFGCKLDLYINNINSVDSTGLCRPCRKSTGIYYYLKCHFCGIKAFSWSHEKCLNCNKTRIDWLTLQWRIQEESDERKKNERAAREAIERKERQCIRNGTH